MSATSETDELRVRVVQARLQHDVEYLIETLRHPDLRGLAATFLGQLGAQEAVEPLRSLLDAHDPYARASASSALGKLGATSAVPRLSDIALNDEVSTVREWAIGALGRIGGDQAVGVLVLLLEDPDATIRRWAATMLGQLQDPRAIGPLDDAISREPWARRRAFRKALRSIRSASRQ